MFPDSSGEWLLGLAAVLGSVAAIITSVSVIWSRTVGPYLAKPIAKAIRHELTEAVEIIFADSPVIHEHIREVTQEVVAKESAVIVAHLRDHEERLSRIEEQTAFVADRMAERPKRRN